MEKTSPEITDDRKKIAAGEMALAQTHLTLDLSAIDRLLHPDYIILQPDGSIESKADVLASYSSGGRSWRTAQTDQLDIHVYGDTGIVTGRWRAAGMHDGQAFDYQARFISVWIKTEGVWENITYQSTETDSQQ